MNERGGDAFADDEETTADPETMVDPETTVDEEPLGVRTAEEVKALVEQHLHLLPQIAKRVRREVGDAVDVDELAAIGRTSLFDAARVHDPARAPFAPYATNRVRWAMLDHIRRETHVRAHAARARALAALAYVDESPLASEPVEPSETANFARLEELLSAEAGALFLGLTGGGEPTASTADPEEALTRARAKAAVQRALGELPERERGIVERHYFHAASLSNRSPTQWGFRRAGSRVSTPAFS